MKNIIKMIVNLAIGLSGLGVIMHLMRQTDELTIKNQSLEMGVDFWKKAYKTESKGRISHWFDICDWKRLYRKYGFADMSIWDKWTVDRLLKDDDEKEDEAEDLTNPEKE